jgi:hypothetical protein
VLHSHLFPEFPCDSELIPVTNWRSSLGILLLGLVLSWTIGSNNRLLHYLCLAVGLATLATSIPTCPRLPNLRKPCLRDAARKLVVEDDIQK